MALENNFYNDIFKKELYWSELANKHLLNIYFLEGKNGIKAFYNKKYDELLAEYNSNQNEVIKQFLDIIKKIITEMDKLINDYRSGKPVDVNLISNLFLSNKMNNKLHINGVAKVDSDNTNNKSTIQTRKRVLESLRNMYTASDEYKDAEYLYDDFPRKNNYYK